MSEITDKLRQEAGFWSSAQGACEVSLELQLGTGSLFGEAADYIDRLEAALTKISSPTQSTGLLWWQIEARAALNTKEPAMHSILRPNYRRARALALEIEAARVHLDEARSDPSYTLDDIEDLKAELHHLEREFSLTGVTSEYDL